MSQSDNTAAKRSVKSVVAEAEEFNRLGGKRVEAKEVDPSLIQKNKFAQIMLNTTTSPEVKRDELVSALAFSKEATKEENRAKLEAFNEFKEYLQEQRKVLNREGIKLQDTEAFAELQSVIDEMTKSSIDFQEKVNPLIQVLTAVFEIRKQDKVTDVYKEIQSDKAWSEEQSKKIV